VNAQVPSRETLLTLRLEVIEALSALVSAAEGRPLTDDEAAEWDRLQRANEHIEAMLA